MSSNNSQTVLPKPTGPYAVGSRYFYLVDKNRPDLISPDPHDFRAISLQVWYPAEPGLDDQPILLNDRKLIEGYVQECALDSAILTEWAMEPTHSFLKAKPVIKCVIKIDPGSETYTRVNPDPLTKHLSFIDPGEIYQPQISFRSNWTEEREKMISNLQRKTIRQTV